MEGVAVNSDASTASVVRQFRLLLRDYVDLAREDWSDDAVGPLINDIAQYMKDHSDVEPVLRELLMCTFLDPAGTQEPLLLRLTEVGDWEELREELIAFYMRRPRARVSRWFRDLAARLDVNL
jgi:hypothetical protein